MQTTDTAEIKKKIDLRDLAGRVVELRRITTTRLTNIDSFAVQENTFRLTGKTLNELSWLLGKLGLSMAKGGERASHPPGFCFARESTYSVGDLKT